MRKRANRGRLFIRRSRREILLFAEALILLYYSKILLLFPFKHAVKKIEARQNHKITGGDHQSYPSKELLSEIRTAVRRADKFSFWSNICIVKSFAARFMLQRRGIQSTMYYGVIFENSKLEAHAWVTVSDIEITPKGRLEFKIIHTL